MADVFVSYARPDDRLAVRVADALRAEGYRVWRDDELPAHRAYADEIEERLNSAKAVVALWSAEAARSHWVRAEADVARAAGTLIQASLDGTLPPLPFNQIQCLDLSGWATGGDPAAWSKLSAGVAALTGKMDRRAPDKAAPKEPASPARGSICVLPFQNMSGDIEQDYFSDGISEDITTDLSKISALSVAARNTAFTFKGKAVDVREVSRMLGVRHILEGSVRKAGSRVRINAQLIDGTSGDHVWAERYDRELTDIFAIQDEISKAIVGALRVKLLPEERKAIEQRGTDNAEAYNLYLMARRYWITGDFGDKRREDRTIRLCQRAVEIDPAYARAWALMGLAQANLFYAYSGNEGLDDGLAAAEQALSLDPAIAEAHLPRAWHLALRGEVAEAEAEIATALQLDPECWEANKEAARILYRQGELDEAIRLLEKAAELADDDFHSLGMLTASYLANGELDRATECATKMTALIEQVLSRDPDNGAAMAFMALGLSATGELGRAREYLDRAMLVDPGNLYMRYNLAWPLIVFFKDNDGALELLEPALARGGRNLISLAAADRNLDPLRKDPRFQAMLGAAVERVAGSG